MLVEANAEQVLKVVTATFGEIFSKSLATLPDCRRSLTKTKEVQCHLGRIRNLLDDGDNAMHEKIEGMMQVSHSILVWKAWLMTLSSSAALETS